MTTFVPRAFSIFAVALAIFTTPVVGQIAVSSPEVSCTANETITVPVNVSELTGEGAYAFTFRVQYDNGTISITGAEKDNTLSAAFTVVHNPKETEIIVSAASASPLSGAGTLINLTVACNSEGSSPLTFSQFTFNEGDPSASTTNGAVTVDVVGEVQINLQINPEDIHFGSLIVGEGATETVTISNLASSGAALTGEVALTGSSAFAIVSGGGAFSIEAGAAQDVVVSFDPTAEGDFSAELQVTHNATSEAGPSSVLLSGSAAETGVSTEQDEMPDDFRLGQNYPNPFNPRTTLSFGLPASEHVRISVYDLSGREQRVLVDSVMPAGWHTVNFDAAALPSGTYLYRMQAESQSLTRTMTLLK